ncbi:MAG: glycosyltransferase [Gemmataceae bacterium]
MRLVHLTASPFFGGPERQMLGLAHALPADHETTIVSFAEGGNCEPFLAQVRAAGFDGRRLAHDTPHLLAAKAELVELLRDCSADVLLCHGYKANFVGRPAGRAAGIPAVAVVRGWTGQDFRVRCYDRLDRMLLRRMPHVVCVSDGLAQKVYAASVPRSRVRVIRNAARADAFREPSAEYRRKLEALFPSPGERIVMSAHRLTPDKGTHILIDAAKALCPADPGLRFAVFGDGYARADLERRVREAGLSSVFVFAGFVPDLDRYTPNADAFVLPSFAEGLPNVVLEACACGVPCVATAVDGTPEVLFDGVNGFLVPAGDASLLANRLSRLLRDAALRRRMGDAGRELVRGQFTFAAQAKRYTRFFEEIAPACIA